MKRFVGIIGILMTPVIFCVWIAALLICLPFAFLGVFFQSLTTAIKDLLDLGNHILWLQGWLNKCHKLTEQAK